MFVPDASAATGWASIAAIVLALAIGIALRRFKHAPPVIRRMRPHYAIGYAALAFASAHVFFAMGLMRETPGSGIRFATVALVALGAQTFVGASLQDPGGYRRPLRAWHLSMIAVLALTLAVHVMVNGGFAL
jgi:hypothetical protein